MSKNDERPSKEMYEQQTAMLSFAYRQELVGKRCIVTTEEATHRSGKNQGLESYSWKQGYIRACSVKDFHDKELQVLVEFDGVSWEYRQWIKIHEQTKAFFVEKVIVWAARAYHTDNAHQSTISWPALLFFPVVNYLGIDKEVKLPVEYFGDKKLEFLKENEVGFYKDGEDNLKQVFHLNPMAQEDLSGWQRLQKTQACLMNGAETLTGARVTVYRLQLRQWYTGCITAHNLITRELHVMDDNVLQTHPVHPALVQINLMANDEELHRILHGEQIKMLPRRQRTPQIYYQANSQEQKSQGGVNSWHIVTELNSSQAKPGWTRPSVVRAVSHHGKPVYVPSVRQSVDSNQGTSSHSLPKQKEPYSTTSNKEPSNVQQTGKTNGSHSTSATKVKIHKPIPVVLKPSDTIPFPHFTNVSQPPRPSNSPLGSPLSNTPSPIRTQLTPSPLSGQHSPSPQSLRSQTVLTPPQNSRTEVSFNRSPSDQPHGVAEKELGRANNVDSHWPAYNSQGTPSAMTSSRTSSVIETPKKNMASSRLVSSPAASLHSTRCLPNNENTEGGKHASFFPGGETPRKSCRQVTPRALLVSESQGGERNLSPESEISPKVSTQSNLSNSQSQNIVPGIKTHRKKSSAKASSAGKSTHQAVVIDDGPNQHSAEFSSSAQQRPMTSLQNKAEHGHSSRTEKDSTQSVHTPPVSTQSESTQSYCTQYSSTRSCNTQACSHLRTIAKIQLEYLIFLEALVRSQQKMILEAIHTINQNLTEEQFIFVADFFCKLVEGNRLTENIFREASFARQERQRVEHQRHPSQENSTCPSRIIGCLPEEIKARLRLAQEAVSREREEVLSIVLPLEELQSKAPQKDWEVLKQQLQKQQKQQDALHLEEIRKHRQGQAESQKQNHLQVQQGQPQQDKEGHQRLSEQQGDSLASSLSSENFNQLEMLSERQKKERQRKQSQVQQESPQANRIQVISSSPQIGAFQSPPQDGRTLLQQQAVTSELLRTEQHLKQVQPLLLQREQQQYEQQQQHLTVNKMVDELFQMKDIEQKTILLQHIAQTLQSQKASSRDVLKSQPILHGNVGAGATESQLTTVQNKPSQYTTPYEVNQIEPEQNVAETKAPCLSADQLLSRLTSSPASISSVWRFTENLRSAPELLSEKQSTARKSQFSNSFEHLKSKCNLAVVKDKSTSGSTSILLDDTSSGDTLNTAGSKMDNTRSTISSMDQSITKKRKTSPIIPGVAEAECPPKPKRQRKTSKKKDPITSTSEIAGQNIKLAHAPPGSKLDHQEKSAVKSVPPGEAMSLAMATGDRAVIPVKANEENFKSNQARYQPRSIIRGIGFVPVNAPAVPEPSSSSITKTCVTSAANHSLDVLASVSASLRTNNLLQNTQEVTRPAVLHVAHSDAGRSRLLADVNQQFVCENFQPTQQRMEKNREHTDSPSKTMDSTRLGYDGTRISADANQAAKIRVGVDHPVIADRSRKQSVTGCSLSASDGSLEGNQNTNNLPTEGALSSRVVKDKTENIAVQRKDEIATKPSHVVKDNVNSNFVVLNGAADKPKKTKKEKQKKEKKTPELDSKDSPQSTPRRKDFVSQPVINTARNMNLLFLIAGEQTVSENKSDVGSCVPVKQSISGHDDDKKTKKNSLEENALSVVLSKTVNTADIEMKETVESPKLISSKLVESCVWSTHAPVKRTEMKEMQVTFKPMDPACATISQDSEPKHSDYGQTLPPNKSSDNVLAAKEKQTKKEAIGRKKTTKKENKSKLGESEVKKSSEKKSKAPRSKKQEKESTAKAAKKSSKVKPSADELSTKKNGNSQVKEELTHDPLGQSATKGDVGKISVAKVNHDASKISSRINNGKETTRLDLTLNDNHSTKMSATAHSKFSDSKVKLTAIEQTDVNQKSEMVDCQKSEDKTADMVLTQHLNLPTKAATTSQDSLKSKLDSSKHPIEKLKKKSVKDEKSTKNNKKSSKKLPKNEVKEEMNVTATSTQNKEEIICVDDKLAAIAVEELVRPEVDPNKPESAVQEEEEGGRPDTSLLELADVALEETGVEKQRGSFNKDIVFVNDQSVESFVNASSSKEETDDVLAENLSSRKRKRCPSPQRNHSVVAENDDIDSSVVTVDKDTPSTEGNQVSSKKNASNKFSDNEEKKEAKVRKKKIKKENVEGKTDTKNENGVSMETDTSALDESVKQDEKESAAEAKKKVKKPKKVRERAPKEEWVYFLQRGSCKALSSMPQCRECRNYETEDEAVLNKSCCRFDMFRRCRSKSNKLEMAGFSSSENAQGDDFLPWVAGEEIRRLLSLEVSKYILLNVGDEFCNLVKQEEKAFSWETKKDTIAWKRAVRGIREMCDACATTIFNVHWVCPKCGFGVCLDCYKTKMDMSVNQAEAGRAKRFLWVRCSANTSHRPKRLVLTHIIPKKTLNEIGEELHAARDFWKIGKNCPCKRTGKELNDSAKIQELPEEDENVVVDVTTILQESEQDKVEPTNSLEQNSELPMETEDVKVTEKEKPYQDLVTNEDANKNLVENEVKNSTESVVAEKQSENVSKMQTEFKAIETTVCKAEQQPVVGKTSASESVSVEQKCQDKKTPETDKTPECKASPSPANKGDSSICEAELPVNEVDKLPKRQADKQSKPEICVENFKNSDVGIVGDSIGALSLLMDYESPVSSPLASPVTEISMEYENSLEITSAQEALLSRPHATIGESSAMISTTSEAVDESATSIVITAEETNKPSETTCESSGTTAQPSVNYVSSSEGDDSSSAVTSKSSDNDEFSAMTEASSASNLSQEKEDISARVQPKVTDELPAPHSWICRRPMLRLHTAHHEGNLKAFQSRWEKGEPVLVSGVHKHMTSHLWTPEGFENEFGCEKADVVNCKTGGTLERFEIGAFWRGFESVRDRPLDNKGEPTLLKLKDWPPEADFVEKMPKRFNDLMNALPLPEYTSREGSRNLVARLPDFFVKPDLGPKMYNAYGNAAFPSAGTTNLHIDMSDAVNVMVYVGVPYDDEEYGEQERKDSLACIDVACEEAQQHRARGSSEKLGALWHIFAAEDANKIRALFHKVASEKNMKYPASHDPIHDQCFYLDEPLLKRLKDEYGVVGWPIAQFLGDAIFIPAGAPHQVRNLHSCVKAAEDFVSPEHVGHCFKLTEEFRHLSEKHTNHEDKLQVKNIIYHAVKDAVSVLRQRERELTSQSEGIGNENV